jgi:hypothetical protein
MKYFQKRIEVEAKQLSKDPDNGHELGVWVVDHPEAKGYGASYWPENKVALVRLDSRLLIIEPDKRGQMTAFPGNWIVRIDDRFYIYSDEEFNKRFEKVEDD